MREGLGAGAGNVAVVIVTYNSAHDLAACLESVVSEGPGELVVVDNASTDDSVEIARGYGATVVDRAENLGFAVGVNSGAAASASPVLVLLNPDAVVHPGTLGRLAGALDAEPRSAVVGPRVQNPDGTVQRSCRTFPNVATAAVHGFLGLFWSENPFSESYTMSKWNHASHREVDWVSAAAMAIRREAFDAVCGFDPGYFMYVEDVDFCWRLRRAGWTVVFEPNAVVTHVIGTSSRSAPYRLLVEHHRSMLRFEGKRRGRTTVWPLIWLGVWSRAALVILRCFLRDDKAGRSDLMNLLRGRLRNRWARRGGRERRAQTGRAGPGDEETNCPGGSRDMVSGL